MTYETLAALAEEAGFTAWASLDIGTIDLKPEVRDMCAVNSCGMYGKRWSCPPGCGTLEECAARLKRYTHGILVQTYGEIEDGFDFETMMEIERRHKANFAQMYDFLRSRTDRVLAIGAGCCTVCASCTYPDEPCRFPEKRVSSMEAYGMLVLEVCKKTVCNTTMARTKWLTPAVSCWDNVTVTDGFHHSLHKNFCLTAKNKRYLVA